MAFYSNTKIKIVIVFIFLVLVFHTCRMYMNREAIKEVSKDPIDVTVYYEALCPDSKHFFVHHLEDAHNKLKDSINIQLIPYGKARTYYKDDEINFECQHGELECFANKIHACTIDILMEVANHLPVIVCMIKDNMDPEEALRRCALVNDQVPILDCAKGTYGSELLKGHGLRTITVRPSFIPTIYVARSKGNQAALLKNFIMELCTYFSGALKPAACS